MEPYRPRGDNSGKRNAGIAFPIALWSQIMLAAQDAGITASEWVRRACREKLGQS